MSTQFAESGGRKGDGEFPSPQTTLPRARSPSTEHRAAQLVGAQDGGPQAPLQLHEAPVKLLSSIFVEVHLEGNGNGDGDDANTSGNREALARRGGLEAGQQGTPQPPGTAGPTFSIVT